MKVVTLETKKTPEPDKQVSKMLAISKTTYTRPKIPTFPTPVTQAKFHTNMIGTLLLMSHHDDRQEKHWLDEVYVRGFHQLGNLSPRRKQPRWKYMDKSLRQALYDRCPRNLQEKMDLKARKLVEEENLCMTARQMLWMMYDHISSLDMQENLYTVEALRSLEKMDDYNMEPWLRKFEFIHDHQELEIPGKMLLDIFHSKIKDSVKLKRSMEDFEQAKLNLDGDARKKLNIE